MNTRRLFLTAWIVVPLLIGHDSASSQGAEAESAASRSVNNKKRAARRSAKTTPRRRLDLGPITALAMQEAGDEPKASDPVASEPEGRRSRTPVRKTFRPTPKSAAPSRPSNGTGRSSTPGGLGAAPGAAGDVPAAQTGAPGAGGEGGEASPAGDQSPAAANAAQPAADGGDAEVIEPEPSGVFAGKRVDIMEGEIPVAEFLRFLADYTQLPVILDSTNATALRNPITIAAPIFNADAEVVKAILENNRWLVFQETLSSGKAVLNIKSAQATAPGQEPVTETPILDVRPDGMTIVEGVEKPDIALQSDQLATMVFTLKYIPPAEALEFLNSLVASSPAKGAAARSKAFSAMEVKETDILIITAKFGLIDYIQKLLTIIDVKVDRPERIVHIIEVKEAEAQDLVTLIEDFLDQRAGRRPTATPSTAAQRTSASAAARARTRTTSRSTTGADEFETRLIADPNTQKIIVITYDPQHFEDIDMLVRELDIRFDVRRLKTRIYRMKFLKAIDVAPVIQDIIGSGGGRLSGQRGLGSRSQRGGGSNRLPRVSQPGRPSTASPTGGQAGTLPVLVVPHEETNSLIIQAEPVEYQEIMNILEKIDVKRRQVFLEAALVQVTTGSALNYTIELLAGDPDESATRVLAADFFGLAPVDTETFSRVVPDQLDLTGGLVAVMNNGTFPALISFFKSNTDTEVLATPFILADDNVQNTINITETRFVVNTNVAGTSGVATTSQQAEDAGITLDIFPTISSENAVFLEVGLEVSAFADLSGIEGVLPPKRTNSITSAVTISDSRSYIVGGLTREDNSKAVSKLPILGDIPLIGKLFRSESTSKNLTNLYIFLRAHILTDKEFRDLAEITDQARERVKEGSTLDLETRAFARPQFQGDDSIQEDPDAPQTRFLDPSAPGAEKSSRREYPTRSYEGDIEGPDAPLPPLPAVDPGDVGPPTTTVGAPPSPRSPETPSERARRSLPLGTSEEENGEKDGALDHWRRRGLEVSPDQESWFVPLEEIEESS